MSRVAKNPIEIVDGVSVNVTDAVIEVKGKVGFRVTDEFGSFETIDLKTFAKRFG